MLFGKSSSYSQIELQRKFRIQGSSVLWMSFVLLIVTVLGVMLLLPDYVDAVNEQKKSKMTAARIAKSNVDTSNEQLKPQENQKRTEAAQHKIQHLKSQLQTWGIEPWMEESYGQANTLSTQGDQHFEQNQIAHAIALYSSAIVSLEELTSLALQLKNAILTGERALKTADTDTARQQFTLALSIAPNHTSALTGINRVSILENVASFLNSGQKHEQKDQFEDARADYQAALAIDPGNIHAEKLLAKLKRKISNEKYHNAMTAGYQALQENQYTQAKDAFNQAKSINPGSAEVNDAFELVEEGHKLIKIKQYKVKAKQFESNEQWQDALKTYQTALKLDHTLKFALAGKERSHFYVQLNEDMDYIIQHPYRLASDQPYNSAISLLNKVKSIEHKGERLKTKFNVLNKLVKLARIAVPITLESDGITDIVIYKVGKLGRFSRRKVNLYPGKYTAVGSCPGYQDVRKEFTVLANQPKAYFIRCEDAI